MTPPDPISDWLQTTRSKWILGIGIPAMIVIGVSYLVGSDPRTFIVAGGLIKTSSVVLIAIRLGVLQQHFEQSPWWENLFHWQELKEWIQSFFPTSHETRKTGASGSGAGRATVNVEKKEYEIPTTTEERLTRLEEQVDTLHKRLHEEKKERRKQDKQLKKRLGRVSQEIGRLRERMEDELEKVTIGGLGWELVVLGWLIIGHIFTIAGT